MRHTPGPWKFEKRSGMAGRSHPFNISANFYSATAVDGRDQVAEIVSPREHAEANARLIAAAPELLQALKDLLRNPAVQGTHVAARIETLIAKAEGPQ